MCAPRFDSEPLFGRIVDEEHGGRFTVTVRDTVEGSRRYLEGSAVLVTDVTAATGTARSTAAMVANVTGSPAPQNLVVRRVECTAGDVAVDVLFDPRLGMPGRPPSRTRRIDAGVVCEWGALAVSLHTTPALEVVPGHPAHLHLSAGESLTIVMAIADRCPLAFVPAGPAWELVEATDRWWQSWSRGLRYAGPRRDAVVRSLITLRLLTYSPTGAPVAAPTTSLPEAPGGNRNWDYRYAWPRDAAIGLAAFLAAGDRVVAHSFVHWLLHASRLTRPRLRVLYDVYGRPAPREREHDVTGFRGSVPVRSGNDARAQHQLDVYGWVVDAAWQFEDTGHRLHGETWRALSGFADVVASAWREPDAGIWEVRGDQAHYVHSKLMAWLALDRMTRMAPTRRTRTTRVTRWARERDEVARWIRARGVDRDGNALVWKAGSEERDAALLLLPVLGFEPEGSPLVHGTIDAVRRDLEVEPGLLLRYPRGADGLAGEEGAFLPCSFWLVQALAGVGRVREATEAFEMLLSLANDVGLLGEELDPTTHEQLGNFPQAFTHATLVQAGLALERAASERAS